MKKLALLTLSTALFVACGVTEPEEPRQICYDKEIGYSEVSRATYSQYFDEWMHGACYGYVGSDCIGYDASFTLSIRECKDVEYVY